MRDLDYKIATMAIRAKEEMLLTEMEHYKHLQSVSPIPKLKDGLTNMAESILRRRSAGLNQYILNMLSNIDNLTTNLGTLDQFYSAVYKSKILTTRNINTEFKDDENIKKIRPEFINGLSDEFVDTMNKIMTDKLNMGDIKKTYISDSYVTRKKQQLADVNFEINSVKDIMKTNEPVVVHVDNLFVQNNIIPFVREYAQNVKEMKTLGNQMEIFITKNSNNMYKEIDYFKNVLAQNKLPKEIQNTMRLYMYHFIKINTELISYIGSIYFRKLSYYIFNIKSINNLYNTINTYFPEGELILHESVADIVIDDMDNGDLLYSVLHDNLSILKPYIDKIIGIKKIEVQNVLASKYGISLRYDEPLDVTKYPYDEYAYSNCNKSIIDIIKKVQTFNNLSKDKTLIVDEMLQQSGLTESFISSYDQTLSSIANIEYYTSQQNLNGRTSQNYILLCMYNDITQFYKNIHIITKNISIAYKYIEESIDLMSNINDYDNNQFVQLKSSIDTIMKNFKEYVTLMARKLISRLEDLVNLINIEDDTDEIPVSDIPESYRPYDYNMDAFKESYNELLILEAEVFDSVIKDVRSNLTFKKTGKRTIYTEAKSVVPVTKKGEGGESTRQTPSASASSTAPDNSESETRTATVNTEENKTAASTENKTEQKNIIQRFIDWIKNLFSKFLDKVKNLTAANDKWLKENNAKLRAIPAEGLKITVAQYKLVTEEEINKIIANVTNKINSIIPATPQKALLGTEDAVHKFLYKDLIKNKNNDENISQAIVNGLTYENEKQLTEYTEQDAKNKLIAVIEYCENYLKIAENIQSKCNGLIKTIEDKYNNFPEENRDKVTANIISSLRSLSSAMCTVAEKKYFDYMKLLRQLAPKD